MDNRYYAAGNVAGLQRAGFDAGLRAHMQRIFNYMGIGLAVTGLVAWVVANTALAGIIYGTPLRWVAILSPLAFMFFLNFKAESLSASTLRTLFFVFCGVMGLSMGALFLVFTGASIARAFFITAATFGAMSVWGYTTKRDLTSMGAFLLMGVLGLVIAGIVNLFMQSAMLQWITSVLGVAIFTGLTAFDVQRIKQTFSEGWGTEANEKLAVWGAMSLYMNFINAFQFLLQLTGIRRE